MKTITSAALAALALALALGSAAAHAQELQRQFPANSAYCESTANSLPAAPLAQVSVISGTSMGSSAPVRLSAALVIRDQSNRTIVSGLLPQSWQAMCSFGVDGSLERLWLLSAGQAKRAYRHAQSLPKARS